MAHPPHPGLRIALTDPRPGDVLQRGQHTRRLLVVEELYVQYSDENQRIGMNRRGEWKRWAMTADLVARGRPCL